MQKQLNKLYPLLTIRDIIFFIVSLVFLSGAVAVASIFAETFIAAAIVIGCGVAVTTAFAGVAILSLFERKELRSKVFFTAGNILFVNSANVPIIQSLKLLLHEVHKTIANSIEAVGHSGSFPKGTIVVNIVPDGTNKRYINRRLEHAEGWCSLDGKSISVEWNKESANLVSLIKHELSHSYLHKTNPSLHHKIMKKAKTI